MTELNSQSLNSRLDHAKERSFKIIQSKKQKGEKNEKEGKKPMGLRYTIKNNNLSH